MHIQRQADSFAYRLGMAWQDWAEHIQNYRPTESRGDRGYYSNYMECPAGGGCDHPDGTHARYFIDHVGKGDQSDMSYLRYRHTYNQFTGKPQLQVEALKTHPDHQHDGVAESLVRKMHEDHPGIPISPGEMTQAGYGFFQNILKKNPSYQDILARKLLSYNTIRCASDDDLILYHGTGADSVPHIQQNGLMHPPGVSPAGWPMLTTDFDQAKAYATRDNPVVLEYHVPANLTYGRWRTHRTGEEPYLWDAEPHTAYDYPAQSYALKRPLPATFLRAVHPVQRKMASHNTIRCATDDYRGYHRGPDADYGSSMDNPDGVFPDIDTHPEYYDTYQPYDYESHHQIRRVRGKPDSWVTVYRALPLSVLQHKTYRGGPNDLYEGSKPYSYRQREAPINTNDWVTPSYSYAQEHGEANLSNEPWTIVQQRVRARSLFSEGNSIHEWAYNGEPIVGTEGDRARRERGLRTRKTKRGNTIRCVT